MRIPRHITLLILLIVAVAPAHGIGQGNDEPYQKDFVITAYYSPLPDQCCYVKGGEEADKELNGEGLAGSDGTAVYPGMIAAPASYPFGTRVSLPGIGVVTVHDRGGAITELASGADRLDLWVGYGEEGLARALAFGVQHVRGTVYPAGAQQPGERIELNQLPSPPERLREYSVAAAGLLDIEAKKGDTGLSVKLLQETLTDAGFAVDASGTYDDATQAALAAFLAAFAVTAPNDHLTTVASAWLLAATNTKSELPLPFVDRSADTATVQAAQRLLRFLGHYRGRTDGIYDNDLSAAILAFQQSEGLVGTANDPGAGRIGPITKSKMTEQWRRKMIAARAERYLLYANVVEHLKHIGTLPDRFLGEGWTGDEVRLVQSILADIGFFPSDKINGVFGPLTASSIQRYQLDRGIIDSAADPAAGYVGPATLTSLRQEQMRLAYRLVRAEGVGVL